MTAERMRIAVVLAFLVVYVVWGTTFGVIAVGLKTLPPFTLGTARFLLAGGLLYAWLRLQTRRPLAGLPTGHVLLSGLLYSALGNGMLNWAEQGVPSGIAALIIASIPICVAMLDWAAFSHRRPTARALTGTLIGALGVALIVVQTSSFHGKTGVVFLGALFLCVIAWSTASLLQRDVVRPERLLAFSAGQMLAGALFQLLFALISAEWRDIDLGALDASSFASVAYLALFGTILGQTCYFWLVSRVPTQYVTTYALVNPVVALFVGVLFLGEQLTIGVALASVVALSGVAVVLFQHQGLLAGVGRWFKRSRPRVESPRKSHPASDHI